MDRRGLPVSLLLLACLGASGCRSGQPMRDLIPQEFAEDVVATDEPYETMGGLTPGSVVLMPVRLSEKLIGFDSLRGDADYHPGLGLLSVRAELIAAPDVPELEGVRMALFFAPPPPADQELSLRDLARILAQEPVGRQAVAPGEDGLTYEARFSVPEAEVPWGDDPTLSPLALVSVFFIDVNGVAVREVLQVPLAPLPAAFPPPR